MPFFHVFFYFQEKWIFLVSLQLSPLGLFTFFPSRHQVAYKSTPLQAASLSVTTLGLLYGPKNIVTSEKWRNKFWKKSQSQKNQNNLANFIKTKAHVFEKIEKNEKNHGFDDETSDDETSGVWSSTGDKVYDIETSGFGSDRR